MSKIRFAAVSEVDTPPSGKVFLFVDIADGNLKQKDSSGVVTDLTQSGGASSLLELNDTPTSYDEGKFLVSTNSGTEWATVSGGTGGTTDHTELSNIGTNTHVQIDTHIANITTNPHSVTKTNVGLSSVPNTDFTTPVGNNTTHRGLTTGNPHSVTKTEIGLSNVPNTDFTTPVGANTTHRTTTSGNPHIVDADDVNCLAKDNTTAFTPDADYEPATKKYVDDNSGGSSSLFGSGYGYNSSEAASTTTNSAPQEKVSLSKTGLSSGTYRIEWNYEFSRIDDKDSTFEARVQLDDTTTIHEKYDDKVKGDYSATSGFYHGTLSGSVDIDLDYWESNNDNGGVGIRRARLGIWRVE